MPRPGLSPVSRSLESQVSAGAATLQHSGSKTLQEDIGKILPKFKSWIHCCLLRRMSGLGGVKHQKDSCPELEINELFSFLVPKILSKADPEGLEGLRIYYSLNS